MTTRRDGAITPFGRAVKGLDIGNGLCLWGAHSEALGAIAVSAADCPPTDWVLRAAEALQGSQSLDVQTGEGFTERFLLLPISALEAAQRAPQPFRRLHGLQAQWTTAAPHVAPLARLLEAMRLIGPPPDLEPHPIAQLVGPMLSTQKVVQATKTSRQNLAAQAKNRRLIRLASGQRTQWWPTFQFRRTGDRVVADPAVQALWGAFPTGAVTDWEHAVWMCTPRHDLSGDAPLDLATDAGAVDREPLRDAVQSYIDRLTR